MAELRRRFVDGDEVVPSRLLARLRHDPRRGARRLYEILRDRQERARSQRLRLEALLRLERVLWASGLQRVAGVDEVGVGPLAGPVVAAAVVFPAGTEIEGVDDSKRLGAEERERLEALLRERATGIGIGTAEVAEIDRLNVYHASLVAMRRAVEALPEPPQHLLVDAREIPGVEIPQNRFDKGDGLAFSIAAASILAKTHRDRLMEALDRRYPGYGFARHKGYATTEHQEAVRRLGPCAIHRRSYGFFDELAGRRSETFYRLCEELKDSPTRQVLEALEARLDGLRDELAGEEMRKLRILLGRRWKTLRRTPSRS